jgi:RNA 3'-terminal phosphate cyclase (ATP)
VPKGELVRLDGSAGEGGGQILRSALALSALAGRPFEIRNVRAGRPNPGLAAQHLTAVRAAAAICGARVEGAAVGSRDLRFTPGAVHPGRYRFEVGTAGSCSLVLQTVALPLALARGPSEVAVGGGTHVPWSPTFEYLAACWIPWMRRAGCALEAGLNFAGHYPAGGGELFARIEGKARPKPLVATDRGAPAGLVVFSRVACLPLEIADRQARSACAVLRAGGLEPTADCRELRGPRPGTAVAVVGRFENAVACSTALGAPGKPAEEVGREAADAFAAYLRSGAVLDEHAADQILLPLALASGPSAFTAARASGHLATNAEVVRAFLGAKIEIESEREETARVRVEPAG